MIKGSIQEKVISPVNIRKSNIGAPKYIKQILTDRKREIDGNTIIIGDFNTSLITVDRSFWDNISKATEILNDKIEQLEF